MNRRNFIKGLLAAGAGFIVPPVAGRLRVPTRRVSYTGIYQMLLECRHDPAAGPINLPELFQQVYAIKRARGKQKHLEIIVHEDSVHHLRRLIAKRH